MTIARSQDAHDIYLRILSEATASGHPEMAPGEGAIQASLDAGDIIFTDDGAAPTLGRFVLWIHIERGPLHVYVQHTWGPTLIHARMLLRICNELISRGWGDVLATWPDSGLAITNLAKTFTIASERTPRQMTSTANKMKARLVAAGIVTV